MRQKQKAKRPREKEKAQNILAGIDPTGKNKIGEMSYELYEWLSGKVVGKGTIDSVFKQADRLWPGHARKQNGSVQMLNCQCASTAISAKTYPCRNPKCKAKPVFKYLILENVR